MFLPFAGGWCDAGAGVGFTLANAITILDIVEQPGQIEKNLFPEVVGRISFFLNAGIRFVEELCKVRVFTKMWDRICRDRYDVKDPKFRVKNLRLPVAERKEVFAGG